MAEEKPPPSLKDLDARLREAREAHRPAETSQSFSWGLGQALNLAIEMMAALGVGAGLGWLLDSWLDTRPWLLVVFLFIGMAAGLRNAYRRAKRLGAGTAEKEEDGADQAP